MYGLVNQAIKDMVTSKFGADQWRAVVSNASLSSDKFEPMESYPDHITYDLAIAASEVLGMQISDVLRAFGRYWILFTANEGYGDLMDMFGQSFISCLEQLNEMHARMGAMMPNLKPPRFKVQRLPGNSTIKVEYHSIRQGLSPMVEGLLEGLAEKFSTKIKIFVNPRNESRGWDEFTIEILSTEDTALKSPGSSTP